jgi:DNA-directed RNA polymerase specialized sigma24 family protein
VADGFDTRAGVPRFPDTRWTRIVAARDRPEVRRQVLDDLCATRWQPLYVHLRKQGLPRERAQDAVQGFLVHLLERDFLGRLDPGRGRLRAYLKTALAHYLANLHEQESAQKRGGGARALSFEDVETVLPAAPDDPGAAFDREWALALFEGALGDLEAELASGARRGPAAVVRQLFRMGESPPYETLAAEHGMTVPQLKSFVHRARQRFRALLLARVADTVQTPEEAEAELGELLKAIAA